MLKPRLAVLLAALSVVAGCASDAPISERKLSLQVLGDEYRMNGALSAELGAWGRRQKRSTDISQGFQRDGVLGFDPGSTVSLELGQLSEKDFQELDASVKAKIVEAQGEIENREERSYNIAVVSIGEIEALLEPIQTKLEASQLFSNRAHASDFRVVTSVAKVLDFKSLDKIEVRLAAEASPPKALQSSVVEGGKLDIGAGSENAVTLSDGVTYAYIYRRLCWKDGQIFSIEEDQVVKLSDECPSGTSTSFDE